jgi:VanZ family protein
MDPTNRIRRALPAAAFACAILILTLRPFDFRFDPAFTAMRLRAVDWAPWPDPAHESLYVDLAQNILFFMPYGAAFFLWRRGRAAAVPAILLAAATSAALSALCETLQVWLPTRYPQLLDVEMNTLGGLAGAGVAAVGERALRLVREGGGRGEAGWDRYRIALLLVLAALLLHPLCRPEPVGSVKELAAHAKAFVRSPWVEWGSAENTLLPAALMAAFAFVAGEWGMQRFPALRVSFGYVPVSVAAAFLAVVLPIPRLFFRPFAPDWGAIPFGLAGAALGIALHARFRMPVLRAGRDFRDSHDPTGDLPHSYKG